MYIVMPLNLKTNLNSSLFTLHLFILSTYPGIKASFALLCVLCSSERTGIIVNFLQNADETVVIFVGNILDVGNSVLVNLQDWVIVLHIGTVRVEKSWNDWICAVLWFALHWKGKDA